MSLVSIKNFVAPLSNKVHLASIVLLAAMFAVWRFQGAGISIESKRTPRERPRAATSAPAGTNAAVPNRRVIALEETVSDDLVGRIMREKSEEAERRRRSAEAARAREKAESSGLNDIEKTLGLR